MKIAFLISSFAACTVLAADNPTNQENTRLRTLQQELIATLKEVAATTAEQVHRARMTPRDALEAQRAYLQAVIDAAENQQQRIKVLTEMVGVLNQLEVVAKTSFESARSTYVDVLRVKADRIKAEILLEKEQAGPGQSDDPSKPDRPMKLQQLQNERVNALKEVVEITSALVRNARLAPAEVPQAQRELLDAELEGAENGPDRIAILKQIVELQIKREDAAKAVHASARGTYTEVLKAKAARAQAEIALEKEVMANAGN